MSLPSGYTRVEYIQSSGTQYINTGFVPNQDTRLVLDLTYVSSDSGEVVLGGRTAYGSNSFTTWPSSWKWKDEYGSSTITTTTTADNARHTLEKNKNVTYLDGTAICTHSSQTFTSPVSLYLCGLNQNGTLNNIAKIKIYSCQIYDNGTLVRDFRPCTNASGAAGLWDDVNSVFYANAGTGTFTAGPEVPAPTTPLAFQTVLAVVLGWKAVDGATHYILARDGEQIGTTAGVQFVDTAVESGQTYVYTVRAANDAGESEAATVTVYTKTGYFQYKPLIQDATFRQTPST